MPQRISSHFHQELEGVRSDVMRMGGLVGRQLETVLQMLSEADGTRLEQVVAVEHDINRLEIEIDEACQTIIARRQPAAGDLRFVLAVIRVIVDLERIGDELKKIALIAHDLFAAGRISAAQCYESHRLAAMTVPMLRSALDAFARLDDGAVLTLDCADRRLDTDYRHQSRVLATYMMEDPHSIGAFIELMMLNKAVERIGDHAKNIAEHVVYLVRGIDVRHLPSEKLHQQIGAEEQNALSGDGEATGLS